MKIIVTAEHIKNGNHGAISCPIALAAVDAGLPPVYAFRAHLCAINSNGFAPLPNIAREFILAYDRGDPVKPFEFEIEWRW